MVKIVFTPDWFLNSDVLIEVVSFAVLFLFFLFAWKCYKTNGKKSLLYLGIGFLLISMGELANLLTKLVLYYNTGLTQEIGRAIITNQVVSSVDIFYHIGFFFNRFLTLLGLYLIYKIPASKKLSTEFLLIVYLLFVTAILSHNTYYLYYLTTLALLTLIIRNYYKIYQENKLSNTRTLIIAFSILFISQIIFLFSQLNYLYVTAKSTQLVSYIILLILIVKILKNGKEKKQNRHLS